MSLNQKIQELVEQESLGVLADFEVLQDRAREVVKALKNIDRPVDTKLYHIVDVGKSRKAEIEVVDLPQPEPEPETSTEKVDPRTEKALARKIELADRVLYRLETDGPMTADQLTALLKSPSRHAVGDALKYLKDTGAANYRTVGYQGKVIWYSYKVPILGTQLVKYIDQLPYGEVVVQDVLETFNLNQGARAAIESQFRKWVSSGYLVKRAGLFYKEKNPKTTPRSKGSNGKSNFAGGGVATSGDQVSSDKEVRALVRSLVNQGAQVSTGGKHISVKYNNQTTTIGRTPSSAGLKQDKANLRAMGLNV